ncbi:MAG TPA: outer membrane beta-barrel protein [Nitrospiraceae bacterium]|nr:outer membrane beta-barrel protein [Nitrospiraceae bacterium]
MKTKQMARRFAITSLLALLVPIVLFTPQAYAESYVAGQFGVTLPSIGKGLSDGDLTSTSALFQSGSTSGTVNFPSGSTVSDQSLTSSLMLGGKIGHYFSKARWFGLEAEIFYSTPHIKQQDITLRSDPPATFTPSGGGPSTVLPSELTSPGFQGAHFSVLTIAPFNLMLRYPGNRLQPYIGVGPGIFIARISDPSITQGENSQSSTKLGLNTFIGARYYLTRRVSAFAEGKYNYVRFNFEENPNFFGFNATYTPINVVFGVSYHF